MYACHCNSIPGCNTWTAFNINHPEFKDAMDKGLQACQAYWEEMGENGIVGNYEKFSASPWIFSMKNRFRADYQEDKEPKTVNDSIVEKLLDRLVE